MPYIPDADRELYHHYLSQLLKELTAQDEDALGGHLNYCISFLLNDLFEEKKRYVRANTLIGALEAAKQEFYRMCVAPYEEAKRLENGDV